MIIIVALDTSPENKRPLLLLYIAMEQYETVITRYHTETLYSIQSMLYKYTSDLSILESILSLPGF